jgi:two-component system chemotaxis response regulator CheY
MGRTTRIMIVDDNTLARSLLRRLLENEGFQVCGEAQDGKQALDLLKQSKPDLIIMDFLMPNQNGIQAAEEILKVAPSMPIVLNTLYFTDQLCKAASEAGVRTVVSKDSLDTLSKALSSFRADSSDPVN